MLNKPYCLLILAGVLSFVFIVLATWPEATNVLEYHRLAMADGQLWRAFSGHFVHLGMGHALLNSAGLLLLAAVFSKDIPCKDALLFILVAPFFISAGLWWKQPTLMAYVGFSGVLHGLLYFGVIRLLPVMPVVAGTVLFILVARQIWEQTGAYNPDYLQSLIQGRVMPDAHLFGAIAGTVWGLATLRRDRSRINTDKATDPL